MTPTRKTLFLAALLGAPAAAETDCALVYDMHARAAAGGIDAASGALSEALSACEAGEGGSSLGDPSLAALAPAPPALPSPSVGRGGSDGADTCSSVRSSRALLLSLGGDDPRFNHLLAECEVGGGDLFGGAVIGTAGLSGARVTSGFGYRWHPLRRRQAFHAGIDLAARTGDPIPALGAGVVRFAGWRGGYGRLVEVEHPVTGAVTRYAHLSAIGVRDGDVVKAGQAVGAAGSSGLSTGPHLHLEVLIGGRAVDPAPYLADPARLHRF